MARVFVFSDNFTTRVEVLTDRPDDYAFACAGCGGTEQEPTGSGARRLADAIDDAGIHADRCKRCADPDCRTEGRHDAGHRCRKEA